MYILVTKTFFLFFVLLVLSLWVLRSGLFRRSDVALCAEVALATCNAALAILQHQLVCGGEWRGHVVLVLERRTAHQLALEVKNTAREVVEHHLRTDGIVLLAVDDHNLSVVAHGHGEVDPTELECEPLLEVGLAEDAVDLHQRMAEEGVAVPLVDTGHTHQTPPAIRVDGLGLKSIGVALTSRHDMRVELCVLAVVVGHVVVLELPDGHTEVRAVRCHLDLLHQLLATPTEVDGVGDVLEEQVVVRLEAGCLELLAPLLPAMRSLDVVEAEEGVCAKGLGRQVQCVLLLTGQLVLGCGHCC